MLPAAGVLRSARNGLVVDAAAAGLVTGCLPRITAVREPTRRAPWHVSGSPLDVVDWVLEWNDAEQTANGETTIATTDTSSAGLLDDATVVPSSVQAYWMGGAPQYGLQPPTITSRCATAGLALSVG